MGHVSCRLPRVPWMCLSVLLASHVPLLSWCLGMCRVTHAARDATLTAATSAGITTLKEFPVVFSRFQIRRKTHFCSFLLRFRREAPREAFGHFFAKKVLSTVFTISARSAEESLWEFL